MIGTVERVKLLNSVGRSLLSLPAIFGKDGRPGNIVGKSSLIYTELTFHFSKLVQTTSWSLKTEQSSWTSKCCGQRYSAS